MTVSVPEATYFSYVTDGVTTAFSCPLRFLSADDLIVETTIGGVTSEVSHSLLTITGAGLADGGTVTFLAAPAAGTLTIRRDTAAKQVVDLENLTKSNADSVETQLDRLAMVQQDRDRDRRRAWLSPVGQEGGYIVAGAEGTVPKFDADGNLVEGPSAAEIEDAEGYAEDAAQSATDAETAQSAAEAAQEAAEEARDEALAAVPGAYPPTRAALAALADTTANAYLTEDGFQGQFAQVDITSGDYADLIAADTVGGEIKVKSGNANLAYLRQRKNGDLFKTSEFGGDLAVALAVASEWAALQSDGRHATLEMNSGTITPSKAVSVPANVDLIGLGMGKSTIDTTAIGKANLIDQNTGTYNGNGNIAFDARAASGAFTSLYTALPEFSDVTKGDPSVTFTEAHGLEVGDIFILYDSADNSWSSTRTEYRLGDRFEVVGVDDLLVYVDHQIRDDYTYSATCLAWKQPYRTGRLGGFTLLTDVVDTAVGGISLVHWKLGKFHDIEEIGARSVGIRLHQCFGSELRWSKASVDLGAGFSSVYAAHFVNSTRCRIKDSSFASDWHSIDCGGLNLFGSTLDYDCVAEDCTTLSTGASASGAAALNAHGNSDMCGFRNIQGAQGYNPGGRDPFFEGGSLIAGNGADAYPRLMVLGEDVQGRLRVQGTKMRSDRNTGTGSTGGALFLAYSTDQTDDVYIDLLDVDIELPNETQPIRFGNQLTTAAPMGFELRGRIVCPSASSAVFITNGNTAVTGPHFRMDVIDLPSGVGFASSTAPGTGGHMDFDEWKFPRQTGIWTTSGAAAATETSGSIALPHPFPGGGKFVPRAAAHQQSNGLGSKTSAKVLSIGTTAIQVMVATGDGTNMAAVATKVMWEVF